MHICILMTSSISNEPRVIRQTETIRNIGYTAHIVGIVMIDEPRYEENSGIVIERLNLPDMRFVRWLKSWRDLTPTQGMFGDDSEPRARYANLLRSIAIKWIHQVQFVIHLIVVFIAFLLATLRQKADIYHAHDVTVLLPALVIGWLRRRPVVYDSHEYWNGERRDEPLSHFIIHHLEKFGAQRCTATLVVNDTIADQMAKDYGVVRPTVLRNVPLNFDTMAPVAINPQKPIRLLYHGAYLPHRGIDILIRAMIYVKSDVRLTLRGFGEIELHLKSITKQLKLDEIVTFAPPVSMKNLVSAAGEFHIGVLAHERLPIFFFSLPNKLFEYMAAGLAILTNDLPEIRQVTETEKCGLVYSSEDPIDVARAIDYLCADRYRLEQMRYNAWQAFCKTYNWSKEHRVLVDLYQKIAPKKL